MLYYAVMCLWIRVPQPSLLSLAFNEVLAAAIELSGDVGVG